MREIALPLKEPFQISGGSMAVRRSLIVELEDDSGRVGIGESAPFERPFYSDETVATADEALRELLLPAVVGVAFSSVGAMHDALAAIAPRSPMARAGVETAWWDLVAVDADSSLSHLVSDRFADLGVPNAMTEAIRCGLALGIPIERDVGRLVTQVRKAVTAGYHRIKVKVDREWHVDAVRAVQRTLHDAHADISVTVDANGVFDPTADQAILIALDQMGLLFVEQPFAARETTALTELANTLTTPICLDETLVDEPTARAFAKVSGQWVWNIKVQRVGGLEPACRIAAMGHDAGIPMWIGTMPETGIGAQAALALATHEIFSMPTDVEPSDRWYVPGSDLVELTMAADGTMTPPHQRPLVSIARAPVVFELAVGP